MKPYELRLAARMLAIAAEEFENFDDNTFDLVEEGGLARSQASEFNKNCAEHLEPNKRADTSNANSAITGDCGIMLYLSHKLHELADGQSKGV